MSAALIPDTNALRDACTQTVEGCEISRVPDCGGSDEGRYCSFDDDCESTCLEICDAQCD